MQFKIFVVLKKKWINLKKLKDSKSYAKEIFLKTLIIFEITSDVR